MPSKFDPVRDAVLNSPTFQHSPQPINVPSSSTSPLQQSPPGRRATDLSVMLNADAKPPTIQMKRTNSLSRLLNDVQYDEPESRLGSVPPLRRADDHQPRQQPQPRPPPPPYQRRPNSATTTTDATTSRPSSSSSSLPTPSTTISPLMPPSGIPYRPTKRVSPADSVLRPMSASEAAMFTTYVGKGAARLTTRKRKRPADDDADSSLFPPSPVAAKRIAGDVGVVMDHYNSRPDVGVTQRQDSPIIGLKSFNNWVKSVIISRFCHPAFAASPLVGPGGRTRGKVLDLGCGKGGDLIKWNRARIREYIAVDIAAVSVEQAESRWRSMKGQRPQASFAALDCFEESLGNAFLDRPYVLEQPFDVVSMQFCMHYAFESETKARQMLDNVSRWLRNGGVFIGTIPNAEQLIENLEDAEGLEFGNDIYKVRFDEKRSRSVYGHKYWFFLQDAVEDVPEYVVYWDNFVNLAAEYDLYPVYRAEFHEVFSENQEHPEFGPLLQRMRVVNAAGESSMDEDQWEAANIYMAFAFSKR